ncbi:translation initiation factor eIF-2B subunit gamma isoform X2 [Phalaenopsis equestris]|uniref:translation initiation factor eIF-2B subunit gamma isoform X2 n=1 Tax=Phalaenopsis equestris TaxID=78828 RepID=UPI0009E3C052|nr:translation initiation factor eIF-2B subunit gamma isoform X2 [Phalaenopsis equestris]
MDFQVVVLAGGDSKRLAPLVSEEIPKPLLPVANRPVLSYVLELLEANNLKNLIVVVEGKDVALRVGGWISGAYVDRLHVEVAAVPEESGTADALRAVAHHFTAKDILVVSGDLVSNVPPGAVAATHRRLGAIVTALLCNTPISGPSESGSSIVKDKGRKPPRVNIVGLDHTRQYLLHVAAGAEVGKDIKIQKCILQANGQMEIRADLMDAHMYAFQRTILQEVLDQNGMFQSIKHDVFPYLVRTQMRSEILDKRPPENGVNVAAYTINSLDPAVETLTDRTHKCCAYIATKSNYCSRLNSVQAFCDINRDMVGEAGHLFGYSFSVQNNIVHASAELGSKTTVQSWVTNVV